MFHRADVNRLEIEPMYRENSLDAFNDQASRVYTVVVVYIRTRSTNPRILSKRAN